MRDSFSTGNHALYKNPPRPYIWTWFVPLFNLFISEIAKHSKLMEWDFSQVVYFSKWWCITLALHSLPSLSLSLFPLCIERRTYVCKDHIISLESLWRCGLFQFRFDFNSEKIEVLQQRTEKKNLLHLSAYHSNSKHVIPIWLLRGVKILCWILNRTPQ